MLGCPPPAIEPAGRSLRYVREFFWRREKCHIRMGVAYESGTSRAENLSDAAAGGV
jgi:hypothetical protein